MKLMESTFLTITVFLLFVNVSTMNRHKVVSKEEAAQASAHVSRIIKEGKCHQPSPRILKIEEHFENSRKRFLPSCTIIHVCSDDTGCCDSENFHCTASKQEVITLYFWVLELTEHGHKRTVESVTLKNDTECSCQSMNFSNQTSKKLESSGDSPVELQSLVTSSHMSMFEGRVQSETISSSSSSPSNTSCPTSVTNPIKLISLLFLIILFKRINCLW